jgi:hypothetical protein
MTDTPLPLPVIRLLEFAERGIVSADVPEELRDAVTYCQVQHLVRVVGPVPQGQTPWKCRNKKSQQLLPGDVIRDGRPEGGYKVERVEVRHATVDVEGGGLAAQYRYDADVQVYDGPAPRSRYSEPRLVLEHKGESALALHRMKLTSGNRLEAVNESEVAGNEYQNQRSPTVEWLTAKFCKDRFNVSGKDLSQDPEAKDTRRKNPEGRHGGDYVYRYDVVTRISNRKSRKDPDD